jgi:GT2 family glycosyltransferase
MADLSIIIVCYKGEKRLAKCLEALNSFTGKNFSTEVIVVDNKSYDEAIFKIEERFPKFRFIYNEINGGFSNGWQIFIISKSRYCCIRNGSRKTTEYCKTKSCL